MMSTPKLPHSTSADRSTKRLTAVTYTQRRSRSIRSIFIPNDCTFGLFHQQSSQPPHTHTPALLDSRSS